MRPAPLRLRSRRSWRTCFSKKYAVALAACIEITDRFWPYERPTAAPTRANATMQGLVVIRPVQIRRIAACAVHAGARIVGNHQLRRALKVFQSAVAAVDPVRQGPG